MGLLEQVFNEMLQRKYRQHDFIQQNEEKKLYKKSLELNQVDELAEAFEQKMELAAYEMEQWLIQHKKG